MRKLQKPEQLDDFPGWAVWIRKQCLAAKAKKGPCRPADTAKGVRTSLCYGYFRQLNKEGLVSSLRRFVIDRDGDRWSRNSGGGMDLVLRLIETSSAELIESGERSRLAGELKIAHQLDIQSKWIVPFLYEAGSRSSIRKLALLNDPPGWAKKYVTPRAKDQAALSDG
jgi:hypothetical protein